MKTNSQSEKLLTEFNTKYSRLHSDYENLFWISYMYDNSVDAKKDLALKKRDSFRASYDNLEKIKKALESEKNQDLRKRLGYWKMFFERYQTPQNVLDIKSEIDSLETKIQSTRSSRKQGYIDPIENKFIEKSINEIKSIISTNDDELIRKACFDALQISAEPMLGDYVKLVGLRNKYAQELGFDDFYSYKLHTEEGMNKKELFAIFDSLYEKTKYGFENIRKLEKNIPDLRKPWNFSYMMAGSFVKEEDPYFPFERALERWGRTFAGLGIDFKKGSLNIDLLERKGKYNNGFCHWPELVQYQNKKHIPGKSNFTCNVTLGIPGQSFSGYHTLFHEGGHAAHLLNTQMKDVCVNHEYAPMSTAWAETQSMFLDSVLSSIEWKIRYAKNNAGESYPFQLFKNKVEKLNILMPLSMMGIMSVMYFEKDIYETKNLTVEKVKEIAKINFDKFFDRSETSLTLLEIPHIYAWESACSYQGYALAELAVSQWRDYFYKKYGHIVDNKKVGKEMEKVWKLGSSMSFPGFVKMATGKKLSPNSFVKSVTKNVSSTIKTAQKRIHNLEKVKPFNKKIELNAKITLVHGKKKVADNKKSFELMTQKYSNWLKKQI